MKKKYLALGAVPLMAAAVFVGGTASAHGMMGNWNATPEQIVERRQTMFAEQAALLGIPIDELKMFWSQGKNLREIAEAKGITQDELKKRMAEAHKERMAAQLQTLVDKGTITQAQADQRLQFMQTKITNGKTKGFGRHLRSSI